MQVIYLTNFKTNKRLEILVDDYAYEFLKNRKISLYGDIEKRPYVRVSIQGHWIPLHKLICGDYQNVDHKNGNQLDNRMENLRGATPEQNGFNRRKKFNALKPPTSIFKGVHKKAPHRNWSAAIAKGGQSFHLGSFKTEEEAAKAYDEKARELFGEFAHLNFG